MQTQKQINEIDKQIERLQEKKQMLLRQKKIRQKAKEGMIITAEELNLLPPEYRQEALAQSMSAKTRKYGL